MLAIKPGLSSGLAVVMLMVAPIPPLAAAALAVLYISTDLTASEARFWKSKALLSEAPPPSGKVDEAIRRPFKVTILY